MGKITTVEINFGLTKSIGKEHGRYEYAKVDVKLGANLDEGDNSELAIDQLKKLARAKVYQWIAEEKEAT